MTLRIALCACVLSLAGPVAFANAQESPPAECGEIGGLDVMLKAPSQAAPGARVPLVVSILRDVESEEAEPKRAVTDVSVSTPAGRLDYGPVKGELFEQTRTVTMPNDPSLPLIFVYRTTSPVTDAPCMQMESREIRRATPSSAPKLRLSIFRSQFFAKLSIGTTCAVASPATAEVVVRGRGQSRTYKLDRPCGSWTGTRRGGLAGFAAYSNGGRDARQAVLSLQGNGQRRVAYALTARLDGKVVRRARLVFSFRRGRPAQRIFRGTDAFVNYCINERKTIRSSGGRLYCVRPGTSGRHVAKLAPA